MKNVIVFSYRNVNIITYNKNNTNSNTNLLKQIYQFMHTNLFQSFISILRKINEISYHKTVI